MASKTKTKSTGKPEKSNRRRKRKRRLSPKALEQLRDSELNHSREWMQLPESTPPEQQGPKLQIRPEPRPPTEGEQKVLDLLWSEFDRSDEVARAAARFETDVHAQLVQRRIEEGFAEDEAGDVHRVFRADEFNQIYRRLLMLRMEQLLLRDLDLGEYEADIMRERIHAVFGPVPPPQTKPIALPNDRLHVGDAEVQQVQKLKARGRRRGS